MQERDASLFSEEQRKALSDRGFEDPIEMNAFEPFRFVIRQDSEHNYFVGLSTLADIASKKRNPFTNVPVSLKDFRVDADYFLRMLEAKRGLAFGGLKRSQAKKGNKDVRAILDAACVTKESVGDLWSKHSANSLYAASAYSQMSNVLGEAYRKNYLMQNQHNAAMIALAFLHLSMTFCSIVNFSGEALRRMNKEFVSSSQLYQVAKKKLDFDKFDFSEFLIDTCPARYLRYSEFDQSFHVRELNVFGVILLAWLGALVGFTISQQVFSLNMPAEFNYRGNVINFTHQILVRLAISYAIGELAVALVLDSSERLQEVWKAVVCREYYDTFLGDPLLDFSGFENFLIGPQSPVLPYSIIFMTASLLCLLFTRAIHLREEGVDGLDSLQAAIKLIKPDFKARKPDSATLFFEESPRVEPALDAEIKPEYGD